MKAPHSPPSDPGPSPARRGRRRQGGAIAVMAAVLLLLMLGFFALAIDMARLYNRRAELQTLADSAAIAAATHLNGTKEGVQAAVDAARAVVQDPDYGPRYEFVQRVVWNDNAIAFSAARDGGWRNSTDAAGAPAALVYVKVDTAGLDDVYGKVVTFFAPVLSSSLAEVDLHHVTVAGKSRLNVTPLAVCAMSADSYSRRQHAGGEQYDELLEYGFRRGVGYNLMNLNPHGSSAASFQVDPITLGNVPTTADNFASWIYTPHICSGTMAVPSITGATVRVHGPFPIGTYGPFLNSRFDGYTGTCDIHSAPPDSNVRHYTFAGTGWMDPKASFQSAQPDTSSTDKLQTVAEIGPPNHTVAADYGPLWSFARAVPWSSYVEKGAPEPGEGYLPFNATTTVWKALYGTGSGVGAYPNATPYLETRNAAYFLAPTTSGRVTGKKWRRVLNIPLLACPVSGSTATVLGIGRFLMTVPVAPAGTALHAEFGGLARDDQVAGKVEIYQ
ncbi:pilus assembly protein TadG-related protein [Massilia sp. YIM B02443]|uniref:pilus assembly protein TadG-related protein n=1 Tax=Massilia sp. YIM B02443 TaxID=3050127 RepID=UPI0025B6F456|nr:pilus assembly protein TadG-related protein [Massilia sp. YIM B02443]MDN4037649.1 pilus assembly protein TadG-related protein [Massilia sp. YIM B02443]